jgi:hypothetical protein
MADEPEFLEAEPIPPPHATRRAPAAGDGPRPAGDVRKAWMLALAADFVQWVLFPVFAAGVTPLNFGVDLIVAFLITRWMGWHLAFLPAFVTELVPIANVVPSWTLAMWIVTRLRKSSS